MLRELLLRALQSDPPSPVCETAQSVNEGNYAFPVVAEYRSTMRIRSSRLANYC